MKKLLLILLLLGLSPLLRAQAPVADSPVLFTPEQLDQLTGPIALYPDPLVALMLPASTFPTDVTLAAQFLREGGDPAQIDTLPWDDSVKALAEYPEVVEWMSENLDWTTALGYAFLQQPQQVMASIQQLRAAALANGSLVNTAEQNISQVGGSLCIFPGQDDSLYVPQYDPNVVYAEGVVYTGPVIFFSRPYRVGVWLRYQCDWDDFGIWFGVWQPGWTYRREWREPHPDNHQFWRPDPVRERDFFRTTRRPAATPPQPRPMASAPNRARGPGQGFRPAPAAVVTPRTDVTGWHTGPDNHLAVPPATRSPGPGRSGPQIITSETNPGTKPPGSPASRPAQNPAATVRPPPPIAGSPAAPAREPNTRAGTELVGNRAVPTSPVNPRPAPTTPVAIRPTPPAPAHTPPVGPVFGGYSRGVDANAASNRGQASLAAAAPQVRTAAPPLPASRPAPTPGPAPTPAPATRTPAPSFAPSGSTSNPRTR